MPFVIFVVKIILILDYPAYETGKLHEGIPGR
jgi:hypothetical protein